MRCKALVRNRLEIIPFRDKLLELVSIKGDKLLMGYGYMSPTYLPKDIVEKVEIGFKGVDNPEIIVIGANKAKEKESDIEENYYLNYLAFSIILTRKLPKCKIKILISEKKNYHGKIAVKFQGNDPIAAIVGSSNISRNTLGAIKSRYFSDKFTQEVDIFIWNSWKYGVEKELSAVEKMKKEPEYSKEINRILQLILTNLKKSNQTDMFEDSLIKYVESKNTLNFIKEYDEIKNYLTRNKDTLDSLVSKLKKVFNEWCTIRVSEYEAFLEDIDNDYTINYNISKELVNLCSEIESNEDLKPIQLNITQEEVAKLKCFYEEELSGFFNKNKQEVEKKFNDIITVGTFKYWIVYKVEQLFSNESIIAVKYPMITRVREILNIENSKYEIVEKMVDTHERYSTTYSSSL